MGESPKVVFQALDRNAEIDISHRNLPHWFQVGAAMFITFRAADSLPREVLLRMKRNHVHAIVQFRTDCGLSIIGQSWMRYSARLINRMIGASGAFWQPEPFDHVIRSAEQFVYLQNYTAGNPARANLRINEFVLWERERK